MNQEKQAPQSPFSTMTYQEQQDKWLEWRSRQLDYQPASPEGEKPSEKPRPAPAPRALPPLRMPNMRIAAPVRRQELDQVLARHKQALKQAGPFQTTAID